MLLKAPIGLCNVRLSPCNIVLQAHGAAPLIASCDRDFNATPQAQFQKSTRAWRLLDLDAFVLGLGAAARLLAK